MSLGSRLQARLEEQLRELRQENDALRGQQAHFNPEFLKKQAADILRFYAPICVDHENGGFFNQILDDGSVYDAVTKHVVGTCRYTVNFSMAHRLFPESSHDYKELCERGVSYLIDSHWDKEHGGMCWVLGADGTVIDGAKYMYSNAFALLALSESLKIRVGNSKAVEEHIEKIWQVTHISPILCGSVIFLNILVCRSAKSISGSQRTSYTKTIIPPATGATVHRTGVRIQTCTCARHFWYSVCNKDNSKLYKLASGSNTCL